MWKDILKKVAPLIGASLGGPFGGMATKFLAEKFLGNSEATEEDLEKAILAATPQKLVELKKINDEYKLEMKKLGIREQELHHEDKKSARSLFKLNIWPQIILSGLFIIGYFVILGMILGGTIIIEESIRPLIFILIGIITGEVPRIMAFWFGSSMGSKEKTAKTSSF